MADKMKKKDKIIMCILCFITSFLLHNIWSILCFFSKGSWLSYKEIIHKLGNVPITSATILYIMNLLSVIFVLYGFLEIIEILGIPDIIKKFFNNLIDFVDSKNGEALKFEPKELQEEVIKKAENEKKGW